MAGRAEDPSILVNPFRACLRNYEAKMTQHFLWGGVGWGGDESFIMASASVTEVDHGLTANSLLTLQPVLGVSTEREESRRLYSVVNLDRQDKSNTGNPKRK